MAEFLLNIGSNKVSKIVATSQLRHYLFARIDAYNRNSCVLRTPVSFSLVDESFGMLCDASWLNLFSYLSARTF